MCIQPEHKASFDFMLTLIVIYFPSFLFPENGAFLITSVLVVREQVFQYKQKHCPPCLRMKVKGYVSFHNHLLCSSSLFLQFAVIWSPH